MRETWNVQDCSNLIQNYFFQKKILKKFYIKKKDFIAKKSTDLYFNFNQKIKYIETNCEKEQHSKKKFGQRKFLRIFCTKILKNKNLVQFCVLYIIYNINYNNINLNMKTLPWSTFITGEAFKLEHFF